MGLEGFMEVEEEGIVFRLVGRVGWGVYKIFV